MEVEGYDVIEVKLRMLMRMKIEIWEGSQSHLILFCPHRELFWELQCFAMIFSLRLWRSTGILQVHFDLVHKTCNRKPFRPKKDAKDVCHVLSQRDEPCQVAWLKAHD